MFEVHTHGRDVFVRPSTDTWRTMKGSDGRDWVELSREEAAERLAEVERKGENE